MREELKDEALESVNGGRYVINAKMMKIAFRDAKKTYNLKCSQYDAMALCDSLIGSYASEAEYDEKCISELKKRGWI